MENKELLLQTALWYARHGLPVFPVVYDGKRKAPACPHGCKDATCGEEEVKALWGDKPFNIGLATGGGLICLDVDNHEGGANGLETLRNLEARYGKLPETWAVQTGTGGKHLYFKCDDERLTTAAGFQPGLDYRGWGGYVVAPPSVHENGKRYQWFKGKTPYEIKEPASLPDWLHNLMLEGRAKAKGRKNPEQLTVPERREVPDLIPEGERNDELFRLACSLRAKGLMENAIFAAVKEENLNRCRPPLPEREVQRLCQQAAGYPAGTGKGSSGVVATGTKEENGFAPLEPFDAPIKPPPFPVHALPSPLREYVQGVAQYLEVGEAMTAVTALGACALSVQGKYAISPRDGHMEPLSLFTLCVARPSERKSPAIHAMTKPVYDFQAEYNREHRPLVDHWKAQTAVLRDKISAAQAAAVKAKDFNPDLPEVARLQEQLQKLENSPEQLLHLCYGDCTPESLIDILADNGGKAALVSGEGDMLLTAAGKRYSKNPNLNTLLDAYSGFPISVTRKSGTKEIYSPALTIVCMLQPEMWKQLAQDGDLDGRGLLARFLVAFPESRVGMRTNKTLPPPQETANAYAGMIAELLRVVDNDGKPWPISLTGEAETLADEIFHAIEAELRDCPKRLDGWLGKLYGQTMRIAGILHCVQYPNNADGVEVSGQTLSAAWEIGQYFRACADIALGGTEEPETESDARYIWERLQKTGVESISKGKLFDACKRFRRASEMESGLKELERRGYIRIEAQRGKGRPSITIHRNPDAG